jgi:hypothetical protein
VAVSALEDWAAKQALAAAGVPASDVELYLFRPGYEAKNAERIIDAVRRSHIATFRTVSLDRPGSLLALLAWVINRALSSREKCLP